MEVSSQLPAPAALILVKELLALLKWKAVWTARLMWVLWRREYLVNLPMQEIVGREAAAYSLY
jgi:hypothetical protein